MDILQAKNLVIEAGIKLVETGLIARTWGNVSCRVDENSFVITPSGKPYIGLTPDDIVEVRIDDLSYKGSIKPSSEKGVHAEVYKAHSDANFVIHTHQKNASVISDLASGISALSAEDSAIIGKEVPIAAYGLPGTGKLKKGVAAALANYDTKAIIMAHHGAVCFGKDSDEAFLVANTLESVCEKYLLTSAAGKVAVKAADLAEFCLKMPAVLNSKIVAVPEKEPCESACDRNQGIITFKMNNDEASANLATGAVISGNLPLEAELHRNVYNKRGDFNYIIHNTEPSVMAVSALGKKLPPLLDDFAQIVGINVRCTNEAKAACALKGRNAVLIKDEGALCCGGNHGDAEAVDMIMGKNCLTLLGASAFGKPKKIGLVDAALMRVIYLKKYSKKASE